MRAARILLVALVALLAALPAAEAALAPAPSAVAANGTFYKVHAGRFADLFGESPALPAERAVLALDLVRPGEPLERWVVPGTEGEEVESSPALLFEEETSTLHLVWNRRIDINFERSQLVLRALTPEGWGEEIDLSAGSTEEKRAIRILVTGERYQTTIAGAPVELSRRIVHLVWMEPSSAGPRPYYSPLVFVEGRFVGWNPVVALEELVGAESPSPVPAAEALAWAPTLSSGRDGSELVAGFVDPRTSRVATVEIRVLPAELGQLADEARGSIIELGQTLFPADVPALAAEARGSIIELAGTFHPAVATHVADGAQATLLGADPGATLGQVADEARGSIIELVDQVDGSGLANGCAGEGELLEIPPLVPEEGRDFTHLLRLRAVRAFGAPEIGAEPPSLLVSPSGDRAMVGWISGTSLHYLETLPDGFWSGTHALDLTQIPIGDAFQALERRLARP